MKFKSILSVSLALATFSAFGVEEIPKKLLDRHNLACPQFSSSRTQDILMKEIYPLPSGKLYILGCELYAYNSMEKAYIVDSYGEITNVAVTEVLSDRSLVSTDDLMGANYDQAHLALSTYSKGRGIGDCGSSSTYQYDKNSNKFVLLEARLKVECDGDSGTDWPVVYSK